MGQLSFNVLKFNLNQWYKQENYFAIQIILSYPVVNRCTFKENARTVSIYFQTNTYQDSLLFLLQFWSAYVPCSSQHLDSVQLALEQIDLIRRLVNKHPESMVLVTTAEGEAFRLQFYAFVTPTMVMHQRRMSIRPVCLRGNRVNARKKEEVDQQRSWSTN